MKRRSIRRELGVLRVYAFLSTVAASIFLVGAIQAKNASFDTLTVHRINVMDREGKLAMILTDHDDFPLPIVNGKAVKRQSGNDENGIVFYNQLGNEQGALIWDGRDAKDGTFKSETTLSYDSVRTDQLLQVDDYNGNGHQNAFMIGWNEPDFTTPEYQQFSREWQTAATLDQKRALRRKYPNQSVHQRFFFGYDDDKSRVTLHDAGGRPRINMFVTNDGQAKLQFLDADGKVIYQLPQ